MNRLGRIARHLTYESDDSVLRCVSETAAAAVPETKTRYAIVGLGGRSVMYSGAILSLYSERAELVGICDINRKRMEYYIDQWTEEYGDAAADINLYSPSVPPPTGHIRTRAQLPLPLLPCPCPCPCCHALPHSAAVCCAQGRVRADDPGERRRYGDCDVHGPHPPPIHHPRNGGGL